MWYDYNVGLYYMIENWLSIELSSTESIKTITTKSIKIKKNLCLILIRSFYMISKSLATKSMKLYILIDSFYKTFCCN